MPLIGIGVAVVQAKQTRTIYEGNCPYCKSINTFYIANDKMHEPESPCRHYVGIMVDGEGHINTLFRGVLP